jgi:Ca-activated chloride channel homolog
MRRARLLAALLLVALLAGFGPGRLAKGNRLYREGRYEEAATAYQEALQRGEESPALFYNLGTTLLRLGRHAEAEEFLLRATGALDPELRQRALYNLGNRFLEEGRAGQGPQALGLLDAAVESYKQALRLKPADADAKFNLELALRERDEQSAGGGGDGGDEGDPDDPDAGGEGEDPAAAQPQPQQGESERGPALTEEQAERILGAAEQDERETYRERLRRGRREVPVTRDW